MKRTPKALPRPGEGRPVDGAPREPEPEVTHFALWQIEDRASDALHYELPPLAEPVRGALEEVTLDALRLCRFARVQLRREERARRTFWRGVGAGLLTMTAFHAAVDAICGGMYRPLPRWTRVFLALLAVACAVRAWFWRKHR